VHGEQNGAIYQEVTLGRSDIAPVSLLAEDRADVLECRINGEQGDHSSHLHPRHTARNARRGQGLWSSLWAHLPIHTIAAHPPAAGPKVRYCHDLRPVTDSLRRSWSGHLFSTRTMALACDIAASREST
jgi:hypothetical protein